MRKGEYWQERFKLLEEVRHKAGAKVYKEIENQYKRAQKEIEAAIDEWYRRFAENNKVSMAEARKLLKADELKEFKWSVEEYIRRGEENAISGEWTKELENASTRFHIARLEALKINTRQSIEALYGQQMSLVTGFLGETYKSDYYHTAFELMKGFEIGFDIGTVNEDYLQKVLFKPWAPDGKNFSDRIWDNKEKLVNTLHKELTQSIMTGADPKKAIDNIAHDMNVSKANAGRLVMTESAYFGSLAQQDCFKELGVEEYEIVATLDDRTSEICQAMDGQHFPMKDFEAGVTAPPFHVNCRTTTCPYFNDEFSLGGERAARGEDGEVYYVPADMKYPEWKEAFVDGGSKEEFVVLEDYAKPPEPLEPKVEIDKNVFKSEEKSTLDIVPGQNDFSVDVTDEYVSKATPGVGKIIYDSDYDVTANKKEVKVAQWLYDNMGGEISLLTAINEDKIKTPDYLWNNKLWELKSVSSVKAVDSAVRSGLKQIKTNPGGIILNYADNVVEIEEVKRAVEGRMRRGFEQTTDIMVIKSEVLVYVLRFKK